ncbi:MAG: hypothetical protein ACLFSQ_03140 [Candidatus Zixiibacteriota bacterium]
MISWLLVIIALAIFQIIALKFSFPETYVYISTVLVLVAALGLLYRAHLKIDRKDTKEIEKD